MSKKNYLESEIKRIERKLDGLRRSFLMHARKCWPLEHPDPAPECHHEIIEINSDGQWKCQSCGKRVKSLFAKKVTNHSYPAPPLNARVLIALGHRVKWHGINKSTTVGQWFDECCTRQWNIPPYDSEVALAIRALEEYCRKINVRGMIEYFPAMEITLRLKSDDQYAITIDKTCRAFTRPLPVAICESIVAHHESGKNE